MDDDKVFGRKKRVRQTKQVDSWDWVERISRIFGLLATPLAMVVSVLALLSSQDTRLHQQIADARKDLLTPLAGFSDLSGALKSYLQLGEDLQGITITCNPTVAVHCPYRIIGIANDWFLQPKSFWDELLFRPQDQVQPLITDVAFDGVDLGTEYFGKPLAGLIVFGSSFKNGIVGGSFSHCGFSGTKFDHVRFFGTTLTECELDGEISMTNSDLVGPTFEDDKVTAVIDVSGSTLCTSAEFCNLIPDNVMSHMVYFPDMPPTNLGGFKGKRPQACPADAQSSSIGQAPETMQRLIACASTLKIAIGTQTQ